jgi:hypothetical protein
MGPLCNGVLPRKGKKIDHTQARQTSGVGHKTPADRVQRIYGFMLGKAQEYVDCASGRQEQGKREPKVVMPYGESNQHVQIDEHRRKSKISKNG